MSITSQVHVIDVGEVELNDLILSTSYRNLVETQNAVYELSHSVLLSFVDTGMNGWAAVAGQPISAVMTRVPEGVTELRITSIATDAELIFTDLTAPAVMATHTHAAAENTLVSIYSLPATGNLDIIIGVNLSGFVRQMMIEWNFAKIP